MMPRTRLSFTVTEEMKSNLEKMAVQLHISTSELIRQYIENGMSIDKSKKDIDFIRKQLREELHYVMDKQMNRFAKLLVRIGTMTVTMCYFTSKLLHVLMVKYKDSVDYNTMLNEAKKKASTFLGARDETIDALVKKIISEDD